MAHQLIRVHTFSSNSLEGRLLVLYCGPSQGSKCTSSVTLVTGIRHIATPRAHHDIIFIGLCRVSRIERRGGVKLVSTSVYVHKVFRGPSRG